MKKSLLAVAVAAALPIAAQAQTNVTMYGVADAGVGYVKTDAPGTSGALRVDSGIMSTSRWGVRGTEDLGSGLSAFFNAEAEWGVDEGTGGPTAAGSSATPLTFSRRSIVGLQGGFGQIFLGREYTPSFYANIANDLFGYGLNGSTLAWNVAGLVSIRYSNAIFWNSPSWGGVQIRAAYGKGAQTGTEYYDSPKKRDNNGEIAVLYTGSALHANAYYRGGYANTAAGADTIKIKQYGLGAGYKFGFGRIVAGFAVSDRDDLAGVFNGKTKMANIGLGVNAGAGEFLIQAHQVRAEEVDGIRPKANTLGVGYTYPLSKRTTVYATYSKVWNKDGASLIIRNSGNSYATVADGKPQAFALGIRHQF
ncbi:MAG: porin [Burkholderiaceae bacterium]